MHVDIVANFPQGRLVQQLVERVAPDHPDASLDGTYLFATEPHAMDDCPFLHGDVLPVEVRSVCGCGVPYPCDEHPFGTD